jgi:hypothetical protein
VEDTLSGGILFYALGLGVLEPRVQACLEEADCVLVDGTFRTEDEMQRGDRHQPGNGSPARAGSSSISTIPTPSWTRTPHSGPTWSA